MKLTTDLHLAPMLMRSGVILYSAICLLGMGRDSIIFTFIAEGGGGCVGGCVQQKALGLVCLYIYIYIGLYTSLS